MFIDDEGYLEINIDSLLTRIKKMQTINLNKCSKKQLMSLPGIGKVMAKRFMDERRKKKFKDMDEVIGRVKGWQSFLGDAGMLFLSFGLLLFLRALCAVLDRRGVCFWG